MRGELPAAGTIPHHCFLYSTSYLTTFVLNWSNPAVSFRNLDDCNGYDTDDAVPLR
jgi:hypothetical protein